MKRLLFLTAINVLTMLSVSARGAGEHTSAMAELPGHLVSSDWLSENAEAENLVVLDTGRSAEAYQSGHVPGARIADRAFYWTEVDGIPGMFPGVTPVVDWIESLGVSNNSSVVIYDAGTGLWAARLAWTFAYLGHENWAVLDGGYGLWELDGFPSVQGVSASPLPGSFAPSIQSSLLVSGDDVLAELDNPNVVVVDSRSPGEYSGSDVRSEHGGHIPGAISLEWTLNNTAEEIPTFLGVAELAEFYTSSGVGMDKEVVTLCQTGVRGAHTWLALTLAGYTDVALYDGSWAEWGNNEIFPVEQ